MTTRQNLATLCALAAALAAGPLAPRADAGTILSSDSNSSILAYPANSGRILGQQFTLNQDTTISDVSAELLGVFGSVGPSGLTNGTYTAAVPEPASLTMIVSGLGVVALLARRRRKARAGSSAICLP
jgi:hypothetical protein